MSSENLSSAVNQQERLCASFWLDQINRDVANYIVGFIDGEGSFNIPIRQERDRTLPFRVSCTFNVSQKDRPVLELLKTTFGCGTIRFRTDGVGYFEITKIKDIHERVIPFFKWYPLYTKKQNDFLLFEKVAALIDQRHHLSREGIIRILEIRDSMNGGGKRVRSNEQIIAALEFEESSEAIRGAPLVKQEEEDMVHTS
jgi:hypothetical protein